MPAYTEPAHADLALELLLDQIHTEVRDTGYLTGRPALAARVMQALRQVPRHAFVPVEFQPSAYANHPLPIGHGQTISQPYIVALMTDLIQPRAADVVLEIGTGSGYQAAILSRLVKQVYSLEIIDELAEQAGERLHRLGYDNVETRTDNGHFGWPEHAPYDAILVTAAAPWIPPALIEQLKPGGTLVIPVGEQDIGQELRVVSKDAQHQVSERNVLPVIFVPMTGAPSA
jgi:protein-L-isoaspartate(D-aspartate) O-methyltransferase